MVRLWYILSCCVWITYFRLADSIASLKSIVSMGAQLSSEERNLVSVAYKNKTGTLRNSWRAVDTLEKREAQSTRTSRRLTLMRKARGDIERELERACQDVLNLISAHLLPAASPGEERVFYHKMYALAAFLSSSARAQPSY